MAVYFADGKHTINTFTKPQFNASIFFWLWLINEVIWTTSREVESATATRIEITDLYSNIPIGVLSLLSVVELVAIIIVLVSVFQYSKMRKQPLYKCVEKGNDISPIFLVLMGVFMLSMVVIIIQDAMVISAMGWDVASRIYYVIDVEIYRQYVWHELVQSIISVVAVGLCVGLTIPQYLHRTKACRAYQQGTPRDLPADLRDQQAKCRQVRNITVCFQQMDF